MKNKKKVYTLILSLIIMTASKKAIAQNIDSKIIDLKDRGYITGYENGDLKLEKNITRAEITKLVAIGNSWNVENKTVEKNIEFKDIKENNWALKYIKTVTENKSTENNLPILTGYPDGTFKPEKNINYIELSKILVVMSDKELDNKLYEQYNKNWENAWIERAKELGILEEINTKKYKENATRKDTFIMYYNTLNIIENSKNKTQDIEDIKGTIKKQIQLKTEENKNANQKIDIIIDKEKDINIINQYIEKKKREENKETKAAIKEVLYELNNFAVENYKDQCLKKFNLDKESYKDYGFEASQVDSNVSYRNYQDKLKDVKMTMNYKMILKTDDEYLKNIERETEEKADKIIEELQIKDTTSDFEKVYKIHDYIVDNSRYNLEERDKIEEIENHSAYGVIVKNKGVCDSYAKAFQLLCNKAGIETIFVKGEVGRNNDYIPHTWNKVKLNNKWYNVDVTWDDPIVEGLNIDVKRYDFFLKSDEEIQDTHKQEDEFRKYVSYENYEIK